MRMALIVARHEFGAIYRRRMFQVITLGLPVIALAVMGVIWIVQQAGGGDEDDTREVGYVDRTGFFAGHRTQGGTRFVDYRDRESGMDALLADDVDLLYVIQEDYMARGAVERVAVGLGLNLDDGGDGVLQAFLLDNLSDAAPDTDVVERLKAPLKLTSITVDAEGRPRELDAARVFFFLGLAFLVVMSVAMTGGFLLQALGEEKENRIMEVLLSSVSHFELMAGKVLGLGGAGLTQILVWAVSGVIVFQAASRLFTGFSFNAPGIGMTLLALALFVLGYLLVATLMAGLGAIAPTTKEAQQLSILLALPQFVPIYAWVYIVENPTAPIVQALTYLPLTSAVVVLQRIGPDAIEVWEVALAIAVLAASIGISLVATARIFRAYLLMYGNRPSLREVARTLARG